MLLWLVGCGGYQQVPPHSGVPQAPPRILALVGATSSPPPIGLLADLIQQDVDAVMLVGDAVPASHPRSWTQVSKRWAALPALDVVGQGERRGDADLAGRSAVWPDSPTWGGWAEGGHRVVWLDATDPVDQRFWLPKGVAADATGGVVVVLGEQAASLESQIFDAVDPAALALLVQGGAVGNAAALPNGRWSYLELDVGPTAGGLLAPTPGGDAFHGALTDVFNQEYPASRTRLSEDSSLSGPFAPGGWWRVELTEGSIALGFRRRGTDGLWHQAYGATWTRAHGWVEG